MENYNRLIEIGCVHEGNILIPPSKYVVPIDINRLKTWSKERVDDYIEAIKFQEK